LSASFRILKRIGWDTIKKCIGVHVKYPLLLTDFNEIWIIWTDFRKILKCNKVKPA
jgi:hypothetical protein